MDTDVMKPTAPRSMDERDGFAKGEKVHRRGGQSENLPADGIVDGWHTFEYGSGWYCSVTWGGRYTGRYQAHELEHAPTA